MGERVIVVGGGPVGSTLGLMLGDRAVVLEAGSFPRDKACGEGLLPRGAELLRRAGVDLLEEGFPALSGVRYSLPSGLSVRTDFADGVGYGVRRLRLDALLAERARVRCGVRVVGARLMRDGVEVETSEGTVAGRALVAADGMRSTVARLLGWGGLPTGPPRHALVGHLRVSWPGSDIEVGLLGDVETYLAPVGGDEVLLAVLGGREALRLRGGTVEEFYRSVVRRAHPSLAEAPLVGGIRGAGPFQRRPTTVASGRVFLAGDAAGFLDPLTGDAITSGLSQAAVLAELLEGDLGAAAERYRHWFAGQWRQRRAVSWLARRLSGSDWLGRRALGGLGARPQALQALVCVNEGSRPLASLGRRDWAALAGLGRG